MGVRSINTDIGLGVEVALGAPANIVVQTATRRQPEQRIPEFTLRPIVQPTSLPRRPCPAAGPFDFPDIETGTDVQGRPAEGSYEWKVEGTEVGSAGVAEIDEFETRAISEVADDGSGPGAFTYKQRQTFLIDDRGTSSGSLTTTFRVTPVSPGQTDVTRTDAGRGLFIQSIVFEGKDQEGRTLRSEFNPTPAVQLIAFPVQDGDGVAGATPTQAGSTPIETSSGVDAASGAELRITGKVSGKKQVDACGERVDSWFVDAAYRFTFTDSRTGQTQTLESNYDYGVAPQYGAQLTYEKTDAPLEEPSIQIEQRIGQVPRAVAG
ncbi:MAG: hypothetical protein ACRDKJ_11145 [Actinomycetota bacterium]